MEEILEKEEEVTEEIQEEEVVEDPETPADNEPEEEVEEWMKDGDDADQTDDSVPLHTHIRTKQKLKGRISDRDTEIERLKAENERLKAESKPIELPKRPRKDDFESDDDYEAALDKYEEQKEEIKFKQFQQTQNIQANQEKIQQRINQAVDSHYERADKLLESSGISTEAFQKSDQTIREAVESIRPKQGDLIVDQFISRLGEGSEKIMFRIGRSKALLGEFIGCLANDPSGLDAATFLGTQKAILLNSTKRKSNAPPPDTQINGDQTAGQKERILKKRYDDAHKKGEGQKAWNAKKEAKGLGIDTSKW